MFFPSRWWVVAAAALCITSPGFAENPPLFSFDGDYRVRPQWTRDPDLDSTTRPNVQRFIQHRFRLTPHLHVNENISAHLQINALEDQIWGGNPGNVLSQSTADTEPNLILQRAYGEVRTPFGLFRVGRMGSHWGKGILSNDGDGFRNEFGDAHNGDTYDRILFATKPMGESGPLTTALLYDKIIETDVGEPAALAKKRGDVDEVGLVVNWRQTVGFLSGGWFTAGAYSLYRTQHKTNTAVFIPDLYLKVTGETFRFDFEAVGIFGKTRGVTAFYKPGQRITSTAGNTEGITRLTLAEPEFDINMLGFASEVGFKPISVLELALETGYAGGDKPSTEAFADSQLSSFTFDPDYNVGLLMFEVANRVRTDIELAAVRAQFDTVVAGESLRQICSAKCDNRTGFATTEEALDDFIHATAATFGPSRGAVRNAIYFFPKIHWRPVREVKMIAGVLWARAVESFDNRAAAEASQYGVEMDYGIEVSYTENFVLGLQTGMLLPGNVFDQANGEAASTMFTVQPRFTVVF